VIILSKKKIKIKFLRNSNLIEKEYTIFSSSEEDFKKNISILALNNSVIEPQRRSSNKEKIIKDQINNGHDAIDNLSKKVISKEKNIAKTKSGKNNAIFR